MRNLDKNLNLCGAPVKAWHDKKGAKSATCERAVKAGSHPGTRCKQHAEAVLGRGAKPTDNAEGRGE